MVTIKVRKYDALLNEYKQHREETVTDETAALIIEACKKKPHIDGYYTYSFSLFGSSFCISSLNADLVDFITKTKHPLKTYGNPATNTGNSTGNGNN